MFDNNKQYINLIKSEQNININYQLIKNDDISKSEQSIFPLENNEFSSNSKLKIETLENNSSQTYICALCEDIEQTIISNNEVPKITHTSVLYDTSHKISLNNTLIFQNKNYYNDGEIDYLISPFTLLHDVISSDLSEKSLNIFILNNNMYCILLDEEKRLSYSCIKTLSPYDSINESSFFEDEITKQKLYEEMYLLELQENISSITKEFYKHNKNSYFLENINIYFNIKQLNDKQLNTLYESLLIDISYNNINLDDVLFKIVKKQQINKQNFITKRKKKSSKSLIIILIVLALITSMISGALFFYKQNLLNIEDTKMKMSKDKKVKIIKEISLPNHNLSNTLKTKFIVKLFDSIDSNAILKEVLLEENESTLVYSFDKKDSYKINLKPKLLKLYKNSQNVLSTFKNKKYTAIISNSMIIKDINKIQTQVYKPSNKFLLKDEASKYLKELLNNKNIKFHAKKSNKYIKYVFDISKLINSPKDFYNDIEKLSTQDYSISLSYPIEFIKNNKQLKVNYKVEFNQVKSMKKN